MKQKDPVLQLLSNLRADLADPEFVWQIAALVSCLALAWFIARWWQKRLDARGGRLNAASHRLAFPLVAMLLVGASELALGALMHVNLLRLALPLLGSFALVRGVVFVLRQAFPGAAWLSAGERIIATCVWAWLALYITDLAPYVIEALERVEFALGKQRINLWMILHGVVTVFLTVVFALWIAGVIENRLMRIESVDSSLRIVGVRIAKALLTLIALFASLSLVGIDMTALSVFTGALGVGLGFGLQKIASNYVSGFIILLDRSIRIGNIVQVGSEAGQVTQITTRYTVLKHPAGTEFIVPNETLIGSTVQNQTFSDTRQRLSTSVGVAYDSDLDLVKRLLLEIAAAHPRVLADPAPSVLFVRFGESSIDLDLGFWIADPEEGRANVISDINFAIWRAFRAHGVCIPFPQREVRIVNAQDAAGG